MNKFNLLTFIFTLSSFVLLGQTVTVKVAGEKYVKVVGMEVLISLAELSGSYPNNPSREAENGLAAGSDLTDLLNLHQIEYSVFNEAEITISVKPMKIITWSISLNNSKQASVIEDFVSSHSYMNISIRDFVLEDIGSRTDLYKDLVMKARQRADLIALSSNQKIESIDGIIEDVNEFSNLAITRTTNLNEVLTWGSVQKPSLDFEKQLISTKLDVTFKTISKE